MQHFTQHHFYIVYIGRDMERFPKSNKLAQVRYDIRGPIHKEALRLEEEAIKF